MFKEALNARLSWHNESGRVSGFIPLSAGRWPKVA
jgi:hypothetical protein